MTCRGTHTNFQPTYAHWQCPCCSSRLGLGVDAVGAGVDEAECRRLHCDDLVSCLACGAEMTGGRLAKLLEHEHLHGTETHA